MEEDWRDTKWYATGKLVSCPCCKKRCHKNRWGNWCYKCNVMRMELIDAASNVKQELRNIGES